MTPTIDAIILANTANPHLYSLLAQTINSLKESIGVSVRTIVVETNSTLINNKAYLNLQIDIPVFPNESFAYNRFLNLGLNHSSSDIILITNNDVYYRPDCLSKLTTALQKYDSTSPLDGNNSQHLQFVNTIETEYVGYKVGVHVCGYAIAVKRNTLNTIGQFDEAFKFWYQDNDYCSLLRKYKLKHALISDAKCYHYGSQSHPLLTSAEAYEFTVGASDILKRKWEHEEN